MKIIEPSAYVLRRKNQSILECIESAARIAYKSEGKITSASAKPFCDMLLAKEHYPVFEFANLHFKFCGYTEIDYTQNDGYRRIVDEFSLILRAHPYLHVTEKTEVYPKVGLQKVVYVSGTVRAFEEAIGSPLEVCPKYSDNLIWAGFVCYLQEYFVNEGLPEGIPNKIFYCNPWKDRLKFTSVRTGELFVNLDEAEQFQHFMAGVHFTCSRAVSHELVRHRPCSFIQQSQRYCNYSNERFGREVTFIKPSAFYPEGSPEYKIWEESMAQAEKSYMELLDKGCTPQSARNVLPNSCATEIIMYATIQEWLHILKLRTSTAADPAMQQVMKPLNQKLIFSLDCFE